jgi:hypothetical protein
MESERNEKFIKTWELNRKINEERSALFNDIGTGLNTILKEFVKYGKEVEEATKKNLQNYFDGVQIKIVELNDPTAICRFLIKEKGKYKSKVIEANFNKQGYLAKDYQAAIDQIIDPLLTHYESELEFEKKIPAQKLIIYKPGSGKQKIIENKNPVETRKTILTLSDENKITKPDNKLPSNFEQITCEGSEQEILNDFMLLATTKNRINGEYYMSENDVIEFVKKNFSVCNSTPTGKYFEINLLPKQKTNLIYLIYQFTVKYNRKFGVPKSKYAMLLINNFESFRNDNPKTLASNMSESKRPKSPLDIILIPKIRVS